MSNYGAILARMAASTPRNPNEYLAEDGEYRCRICGQRTWMKRDIPDVGHIEAPITCACDEAALAAIKQRERLEEIDRCKSICFSQSSMRQWRFENDDRADPRISDAMRNYADNFPQFLGAGKGLLLFGGVGTGKSFFAACIANRLIEDGYSARMTNFASLVNDLQGLREGRNEYIESLNRFSLLVLDDLGAERSSEYMQELVFNLIDSRIRSGLPMIVTTNLPADALKRPESIGAARIYDRLLGCCFPVEVAGQSRRRKELRQTFDEMRGILGL